MEKPLVSVCIITYNHAQYIGKAIDSVLMQNVSFPWEVIIADDFSTDGTREILITYAKNNPSLIRLLLQESNVGPSNNFHTLINAANGDYIAYLEGDDYWISNKKLQIQYESLCNHKGANMCVHNSVIIGEKGSIITKNNIPIDLKTNYLSFKAILELPFSSSTLFFRNDQTILNHMLNSDEYHRLRLGDSELKQLFKCFGEILYIDKTLSAYRRHPLGVSAINIYGTYSQIERFNFVLNFLKNGSREEMLKKIKSHHHYLFFLAYKNRNLLDFIKLFKSYILTLFK